MKGASQQELGYGGQVQESQGSHRNLALAVFLVETRSDCCLQLCHNLCYLFADVDDNLAAPWTLSRYSAPPTTTRYRGSPTRVPRPPWCISYFVYSIYCSLDLM